MRSSAFITLFPAALLTILLAAGEVGSQSATQSAPETAPQSFGPQRELIVSGWDEVFILDLDSQENGQPRKIWSWKGSERGDLPEELRPLFATTDDTKSFEDGRKILITSSGGAVAYVDREQDRVLFYGRATNAHSADLLPGGRIAVAASHAADGTGDQLIIFDIDQPDEPLWREELSWGHGVVWDERRQRLWALSGEDIRVYQLADWDTAAPKLVHESTTPLPEGGGHELYPVPHTSWLYVTTSEHCWLFNRDTKVFFPHPVLADLAHVKSISQHPGTGQIVFIQAEGENWWAENIHFLFPSETLHVPGEHFYKARWNVQLK